MFYHYFSKIHSLFIEIMCINNIWRLLTKFKYNMKYYSIFCYTFTMHYKSWYIFEIFIKHYELNIRRHCLWYWSSWVCSLRTSFSIRFHFIYLGKKVLHIDRNPFYGGEGASLNLTNLWKVFRPGKNPPNELGQNRDWNIDLIPKYIMSGGKLVKILLKTRVSRYLEWKSNIILM